MTSNDAEIRSVDHAGDPTKGQCCDQQFGANTTAIGVKVKVTGRRVVKDIIIGICGIAAGACPGTRQRRESLR